MMRLAWFLPFCLLACNPLRMEDPRMAEGVEAYSAGKWQEAEQIFDDSVEKTPSSEGHFNRGMSRYRQGRHEEASQDFRRTLTSADDALKARAWFDVGNAAAKRGKLDDAIHAYRRSLAIDPTDADVLYNLEWALRMKERKDEQPNGDSDEQQDKDQNKDKDDKDGDGKDSSGGQAKNDGSTDSDDGSEGDKGESDEPDGDRKNEEQANADGDPEDKKPGDEDGDEGEERNDPTAHADSDRGEEEQGDGQPAPAQQASNHDEKSLRPLDAQDIGEVLDALQASEKSLQMWRFDDKRRDAQRKPVEKDW